ncbi:hypothetical protein FS837_008893 [Tulasnella sp. UAMH 9824]|nr:hypothetical protein FS837_008893 [Tulasnella sp. UAMH 9824]
MHAGLNTTKVTEDLLRSGVLGEASLTTEGEDLPGKILKFLLEGKSIPKVLYDRRHNNDTMYNSHKVDMRGVIDSQLMELATPRTIRNYAGLSLQDLVEWEQVKSFGNVIFESRGPQIPVLYEVRPPNEKVIEYSIQDCTILPALYNRFDRLIQPMWRRKFEEEVPVQLALPCPTNFYISLYYSEAPINTSESLQR